MYTDTVRRWATDHRRVGRLNDADGIGEVGLDSSTAGTRLAARFTLKVTLGHVVDARYQVYGCGFSMAACAVAAEMAIGHKVKELQQIDAACLDEALAGLPPERGYCADLAVAALHAAARSAGDNRQPSAVSLANEPDHGAMVTVDDPVYQFLMSFPAADHAVAEDRHLFACLLAVAAPHPAGIAAVLGLEEGDVDAILESFFPGGDRALLERSAAAGEAPLPQANPEVLAIIQSHLPAAAGPVPRWLARILATRAALPGHLWVAMGLTERPQLTAAIRRHLPSLAAANDRQMRWKRFLYKQVCERNGGVMCKSPNCGACSDYSRCFAE